MNKLMVDPMKCTGCRACTLACSSFHYKKYSPELSRIKIVKFEETGADIPVVCKQCKNAPCIKACPTGALLKNEQNGAILIVQEKCIGCALCVEACVTGVITLNPENNLAMVCDLCDGDPQCVKICPVNAINFEDPNKMAQKKRIELAKEIEDRILTKWGLR